MDVQCGEDHGQEETAVLTADSRETTAHHDPSASDNGQESIPLNHAALDDDGTEPPEKPSETPPSTPTSRGPQCPPRWKNYFSLAECKYLLKRPLVWLIFAVPTILLIVAVCYSPVALGQSRENLVHRGPECPDGWISCQGRCYYFSPEAPEEERNCTSSLEFCSFHNASLVTMENKDVMDFVMQYKCSGVYWIGLKKNSHFWMWLNGNPANVNVIGHGGDCAILTNARHFEASSSRCSTPHRWICSKPAAFQKPKES